MRTPQKNEIINATEDSRLGGQHQSNLHANLANEIQPGENIIRFCTTSGAGPENEKWHTHSVAAQPPGGLANPDSPVEGGTTPPSTIHRRKDGTPPRTPSPQESQPLHKSCYLCCGFSLADGHTTSNAPDLLRPPKLSGVGPGQY